MKNALLAEAFIPIPAPLLIYRTLIAFWGHVLGVKWLNCRSPPLPLCNTLFYFVSFLRNLRNLYISVSMHRSSTYCFLVIVYPLSLRVRAFPVFVYTLFSG
jgi:hypothetical protein